MNRFALITGVTGQDDSYLVDFLLEKGYEVHDTIRRSSVNNSLLGRNTAFSSALRRFGGFNEYSASRK